MSPAGEIMVQKYGEIYEVIFMDARIMDEQVINQIGDQLFKIAEETEKPQMLLNFENVKYLSSAVLGKLVALHKRVKGGHGVLKLCGITADILEIFKITKLDRVFQIFGDSQKAIASFQGRIIK